MIVMGISLQTTIDIALEEGWSWFSLNVVPESNFISDMIPADGAVQTVFSQTGYTQYYNYQGNELWYPDDFALDVTETYVVFSNEASTISITGDDADVSTPIELGSGWNWISYLPQVSWDVDSALNSATLNHGDILKTQTSFTNYYGGWGWYPGAAEGFLLYPTDGLKLNVVESSTLIYPSGDGTSMQSGNEYETLDDLNKRNLIWNVDYAKFEFNGAITSKVIIDNVARGSENDLLAVFVGDECRGVARAAKSPFSDDYVFLLMAYSNKVEDEKMSFSYYDAKKDFVYEHIQTIEFEGDMVRGDAINSYNVRYNESQIIPTVYNLSDAYPNPFNPSTNIEFSIANDGYTNISIYNLQGRTNY